MSDNDHNTIGLSPLGDPDTFQGCIERVNPTKASLEQLGAQPDTTPFMMLNLLRFRPRGDPSTYMKYAERASGEVKKVNSFVSYFGKAINDFDPEYGFDDTWDFIVIPIYHRRRSFLTMQKSPIYQEAMTFRLAGSQRRTLYPLADGNSMINATNKIADLATSRQSIDFNEDEIFVLELMRFKDRDGTTDIAQQYGQQVSDQLATVGAETVLSLATEKPVLSEYVWDHFHLYRFPNRAALETLVGSQDWKTLQQGRSHWVSDCLRIASKALPLPV